MAADVPAAEVVAAGVVVDPDVPPADPPDDEQAASAPTSTAAPRVVTTWVLGRMRELLGTRMAVAGR